MSETEGELVVASPADTREIVARHTYDRGALRRAIEAARSAFPAWRGRPRTERADLLRRYQARLRAHREAIADTLCLEVGKPRWEARTEVDAMIAKVDLVLGEGARYTQDQTLADLPGEIRYRPHGVVAVIGPFNLPGHLPNGQILPALALGNTVVHKPSERAPGAAVWIARCLQEAGVPGGVLGVVQGPGSFGAELATHTDVDAVMFTGSAEVGRRIVASQRDRLDRLIALELGGKNLAIVLGDCDLERTARAIAFAAYVTAGQRCTATSQVLATRDVADALCARLTELARGLRVGHPWDDPGPFLGPVISADAAQRILEAQALARAAGYEPLVAGGSCEVDGRRPGHYLRPALHVLRGAGAGVPGYDDTELFGPDLAIRVVGDLEHALDEARRSRYGLSAAVFTQSRAAFERAADELRVGVLHWNRSTAGASGRLPFGGLGDSGNHRPAGILTGASCAYPLGILLPEPASAPLPGWPGMKV